MIQTFTVLDLETTGLDPKKDKIIEIGAIKIVDGLEVGRFQSMVSPGRKLDEVITEITGIGEKDLENAPDPGDVLPDFLTFADTECILGHCILFDYSFLKRNAVNLGLAFEKKGLDTLLMARKYLPDMPSRSLGSLCQYFGIPHNAHRALEDTVATWELYGKLCENFPVEQDFQPAPLVYQVKKESPITRHQIQLLQRFLDYHQLEADRDMAKMTRNEASRYLDRMILRYGRVPGKSE